MLGIKHESSERATGAINQWAISLAQYLFLFIKEDVAYSEHFQLSPSRLAVWPIFWKVICFWNTLSQSCPLESELSWDHVRPPKSLQRGSFCLLREYSITSFPQGGSTTWSSHNLSNSTTSSGPSVQTQTCGDTSHLSHNILPLSSGCL